MKWNKSDACPVIENEIEKQKWRNKWKTKWRKTKYISDIYFKVLDFKFIQFKSTPSTPHQRWQPRHVSFSSTSQEINSYVWLLSKFRPSTGKPIMTSSDDYLRVNPYCRNVYSSTSYSLLILVIHISLFFVHTSTKITDFFKNTPKSIFQFGRTVQPLWERVSGHRGIGIVEISINSWRHTIMLIV